MTRSSFQSAPSGRRPHLVEPFESRVGLRVRSPGCARSPTSAAHRGARSAASTVEPRPTAAPASRRRVARCAQPGRHRSLDAPLRAGRMRRVSSRRRGCEPPARRPSEAAVVPRASRERRRRRQQPLLEQQRDELGGRRCCRRGAPRRAASCGVLVERGVDRAARRRAKATSSASIVAGREAGRAVVGGGRAGPTSGGGP